MLVFMAGIVPYHLAGLSASDMPLPCLAWCFEASFMVGVFAQGGLHRYFRMLLGVHLLPSGHHIFHKRDCSLIGQWINFMDVPSVGETLAKRLEGPWVDSVLIALWFAIFWMGSSMLICCRSGKIILAPCVLFCVHCGPFFTNCKDFFILQKN